MKNGERKRFIPLTEYPDWTVFYDTENQAVPYVLVSKKNFKIPETTQDLMEMHVSLFSGENLISNFLNTRGEQNGC